MYSLKRKTAVLSQQGRLRQSSDRPLFNNKTITRVEVSFQGSQPSSHKTIQYDTKKQIISNVIRETISVS